jgi:putative PIN family toxin of toxin-antitoxin system
MKNTPKSPKLFLDTSALLSGLNSPLGASGFILALFKLNKVSIVISPEVILEAEKVIQEKFSLLKGVLNDFLTEKPIITKKLTSKELNSARNLIHSEDAPILAGAIKAQVDYLITLDKKFQRLAQGKIGFKIFLPGEFLKVFREV